VKRLQRPHALWATAFCRGDLEVAVAHAEEGWALCQGDRVSEIAERATNADRLRVASRRRAY